MGDGQIERRVRELELLRHPSFLEACRNAGFELVAPSQLSRLGSPEKRHAA
jgi:hypothetical protein